MARPERRIQVEQQQGFCRCAFQAMGSPCEVLAATEDPARARQLADVAAAEAWRIEDKFSRYLPGNVVAAINTSGGGPVSVDQETADLIDFAQTLFDLSNGRFDITSGVLRRAWTFDGSDRVPSKRDVKELLAVVGWQKVAWHRPTVHMPKNMEIDFGGIGKEFAVDRAAEQLSSRSGIGCLINFGGDLVVSGAAPEPKGWQVGIESLRSGPQSAERRISLRSGALATSGDARRFLLKDEKRYGHILDATTGWPVDGAPRSITVAAGTCTQAGMLATLAMLNGQDAERWLSDAEVQFWALR